ncbi:MAG: PIN domain-containing protein [Dehalococcoidia bacterium]
MILLDTSAIYALADDRDPNHHVARRAFEDSLASGEELLLSSYVVSEAAALIQRRLGVESTLTFLEQCRLMRVHWMDADDHDEAVALFTERARRRLSLTDCASFIMMRKYGVTHALAYDGDFEAEGFERYRGTRGRGETD